MTHSVLTPMLILLATTALGHIWAAQNGIENLQLPAGKVTAALWTPSAAKQEGQGLLVVLHGAGGNARDSAWWWRSALEQQKRSDISVLALQGSRKASQGFLWTSGDIAAIASATTAVVDDKKIDAKRVYLTGYSMGCSIGFAAIAAHPGRFVAFGGFANGLPRGLNANQLKPAAAKTDVFLCIGKKDQAHRAFAGLRRALQEQQFRHEAIEPAGLGHTMRQQEAKRFITLTDEWAKTARITAAD